MIEKLVEYLLVSLAVGVATGQLSILNPSSRNPSPSVLRSSGTDLAQRGLHALQPLEDDSPHDALSVKPGNISCYSCKLDFRKKEYDMNNACLGRHNGRNVSDDFLVACGYTDVYCKVERMEVNGILLTLTRECTPICYYGCRPKGFGINYETCAECCVTDGCNSIYPKSEASTLILSIEVFLSWLLLMGLYCRDVLS